MTNEVFAVAPKITKRNFLRKIYEYKEICNEIEMQDGEGRSKRLQELFGKRAALAVAQSSELIDIEGAVRGKHRAILEPDLSAQWCSVSRSIRVLARNGRGVWWRVADVGPAFGGRTRYEVADKAPALLLKRWTPATMDVVRKLKRPRHNTSKVFCGTKDGWMHGACDWYPQLSPRHIAVKVQDVCRKIEEMEGAPSAFKQDAIMFANEVSLRTQIFGSLHRRYIQTPAHMNNPFNDDVAVGGEFTACQMNILLQAPSSDYPSGLRIMATLPPLCFKGFPEVMYFIKGVGDYQPDRPRPGASAVDTLESLRVFTRMCDALSHIMEWCASTVEVPC